MRWMEGLMTLMKRVYKPLGILIFGLLMLLLNAIIDLGVIPYLNDNKEQHGVYNAVVWIVLISSKILLALGTASIINYITVFVKEYERDYSELSEKEAVTIIKKIVSNNNNLLDDYKSGQAEKIYKQIDNTRTNATYSVDASIKDGRVCVKTTQSYVERKSKEFSRISNYSNSQNMEMESIRISDPNDRSKFIEYKRENVKEEVSTAFNADLKFERFIEIPEEFKKLDSLSVDKTFNLYGGDHWIHYALMFMRPSQGVIFNLITRDDLVIKEVTIFGDNKSFSKTQHEQELQITSNGWISNNNGFSIIIAKKDKSVDNTAINDK